MPAPAAPNGGGCTVQMVQDILSDMKSEIVLELQYLMKSAQIESLDKHRELINSQEELFLRAAVEQHRALVKTQEKSLESMITGILSQDVNALKFMRQSSGASSKAFSQMDVKDISAKVLEQPGKSTENEEKTREEAKLNDAVEVKMNDESLLLQETGGDIQIEQKKESGNSALEVFQQQPGLTSSSLNSLGRGATLVDMEVMSPKGVKVEKEPIFKDGGFCVQVVESHTFHVMSVVMICANAVYIGVDQDWNKAKTLSDADWGFQLCDHVFCAFFFTELLIRFGAFRHKKQCLKDGWFMLDFAMVCMMVLESWIFTIVLAFVDGSAPSTGAVGGIGRMFRLLRLTRISKLMHMVPELVTMVKAMISAIRAVHAALLILILLVYIFAIVMNVIIGEEPEVVDYFASVRDSMVTLVLSGVFLDDISGLARVVIALGNVPSIVCLVIFVLLSALTVMNMLIGVLCEVVLEVSAEEKEKRVKDKMQKTLLIMLQKLDEDNSGELSKAEVQAVICDPDAVEVMKDIQVDTQHLLDITEMLYTSEDSTLPISVIMSIVLSLRGRRAATMNDLAKGYNFMLWALETQLAQQKETVDQALQNAATSQQPLLTAQQMADLHESIMHHSKTLKEHQEALHAHRRFAAP
jgi:voltage-gated sodium channel